MERAILSDQYCDQVWGQIWVFTLEMDTLDHFHSSKLALHTNWVATFLSMDTDMNWLGH